MRAALLSRTGTPGSITVGSVPEPVARAGEVVIAVAACGVNRIDLLMRDGETPTAPPLPHIMGCETAGTIAAIGPEVGPQWSVGDRVLARSLVTCGACRPCRTGRDNICDNLKILGVDLPGGYAELVAVPARNLFAVADSVPLEEAAAVVGTGPTAWHMLITRGRLKVGETVLIVAGASGIGVLAVQVAKAAGARVIATAGTPEKRQKLLELGADEVVDHSRERWHRDVRSRVDEGVDLVFEHVGQATWTSSVGCLRKGGRLVICGGHTGFDVSLNLWTLFAKEIELIGSFAGTGQDLQDILAAVASGAVRPVIHSRHPLEEAFEAQELLNRRASTGKVVLVP